MKAIRDYNNSWQVQVLNQRHWFVYVLELHDVYGFYTGIAGDFLHRLRQHCAGMGAIATERFGVRRLHHLEQHLGFQVAQFREASIGAYYRSLGVLSFYSNRIKQGDDLRAERPRDGTRRMSYNDVGDELMLWCRDGEHPLPLPTWTGVPALRSDLTAPVPPAGSLTQSALL